MTNLEWIKTLSAKEMQEFLSGITDCSICIFDDTSCWERKTSGCVDGMIKWLESEHKDYEGDDEYDEG